MSELDKLLVLEEFYAQQIWFLDFGGNRRLMGVSIKVDPSGILAILKAISPEGPQVAFVGASTFDQVRRKLSGTESRNTIKWRADQFALDRTGT